jgi:hypothetical protein
MAGAPERPVRYPNPKFTEHPFRPYATAIGQAALAWNDLSEEMGLLFLTLMGAARDTDPRKATQVMRVWQITKNDRTKRGMLKEAVETMGTPWTERYPKALEDIKWLIGQSESLEDRRNDVVHAPLQLVTDRSRVAGARDRKALISLTRVVVHDWFLNYRAGKLANKELLSEIRWCRDQAVSLRDFTSTIDSTLRFGRALPQWPRRPQPPPHQRLKGR